MVRRSRLTVPLSDEHRLEIMIEKEAGTVKGFVVNYVATIKGRAHSVVRYDTRHGFPHKDMVRSDGSVAHKERMPDLDGHALVDLAIDDLKANWQSYRRRFER
jgi:hypothetical protein